MKKHISPLVFITGTFIFLITGCAYSNVKLPLDQDVSETVLGPKEGRASIHSIAWLVSWGDAGTAAAAKNGGLQQINHLDAEYSTYFFGLYAKRTTIAYGE